MKIKVFEEMVKEICLPEPSLLLSLTVRSATICALISIRPHQKWLLYEMLQFYDAGR